MEPWRLILPAHKTAFGPEEEELHDQVRTHCIAGGALCGSVRVFQQQQQRRRIQRVRLRRHQQLVSVVRTEQLRLASEQRGESACSGYLNCACPGGSFSQTAAESSSCQQQIDSSCASAEQSIVSCEEQNCASQCGISGGSSGGGSGSGSGSGSSSGGTGDTTFSCVVTTGTTTACTGYTGPSSETSTYQQSCTAEGGTAGTGCPTTNLVGCCKTSVSGVTSEACYYDAQTGMAAQSACTGSDETWSTSP
jgi:hypothetical protein